jgi:hypothetical protein
VEGASNGWMVTYRIRLSPLPIYRRLKSRKCWILKTALQAILLFTAWTKRDMRGRERLFGVQLTGTHKWSGCRFRQGGWQGGGTRMRAAADLGAVQRAARPAPPARGTPQKHLPAPPAPLVTTPAGLAGCCDLALCLDSIFGTQSPD